MKIETTITLTTDELNKYVLDGLKADGKPLPDGVDLSIVIAKDAPLASANSGAAITQVSSEAASTAPIGQTINGFTITHYGYPGDSSPDSGSMAGKGDRNNKLVPNLSVALTESARQKLFGVSKPSTGNIFCLGGCSFQDDDSAPESDMRVDVYDPYYPGTDSGCTSEMYAKSKAEMISAGILTA